MAIAKRHPLGSAAARPALLHAGGTGSHRLARDRIQDRHPALLLLPDRPRRSQRPDPAAVGALAAGAAQPVGLRAGRSARRGQRLARARPDASLPRPRPAGDHPRLHHVLPLLHAQAGDDGARRLGRRQPQRRAHDRIRPRPPGDPRRHRLRRRPADAAGRQAAFLPRQPGRHPARRCHPHRHARAGDAAAEAVRSKPHRPAGLGRQGVDSDALQPPARDHAGSRPGLPGPAQRPACRSTTTPC